MFVFGWKRLSALADKLYPHHYQLLFALNNAGVLRTCCESTHHAN